jgi:hypothetical protein
VRFRLSALLCVALFVLLTAFSTAHAQLLSVYGDINGVHATNVQVSSDGTTKGGWASSYGGGVTANFLSLPMVRLGVDARGIVGAGANHTSMAEISLRLGFEPPVLHVKPFVQVGAGYAAPSVQVLSGVTTTYTGKYVTVGGHAGVDRRILPRIDWRVVDVGFAHGYKTGSGFGGTGGKKDADFLSIGMGLVARF